MATEIFDKIREVVWTRVKYFSQHEDKLSNKTPLFAFPELYEGDERLRRILKKVQKYFVWQKPIDLTNCFHEGARLGILLESMFTNELCELPEGIYIHKFEKELYDSRVRMKCNRKTKGILLKLIIKPLNIEVNMLSLLVFLYRRFNAFFDMVIEDIVDAIIKIIVEIFRMRYEKGYVSYDQLCKLIGLIMSNVDVESFVKIREEAYLTISNSPKVKYNGSNEIV